MADAGHRQVLVFKQISCAIEHAGLNTHTMVINPLGDFAWTSV